MTKLFRLGFLWICLLIFVISCIEPFEPQIIKFTSALVVEATITDENKEQEIFITRTFPLDTSGVYGESGAKVQVLDSNGGAYDFSDQGQGRYVSNMSFAAQSGIGYTLNIVTKEGVTYSSTEEIAPNPTQIDSVYAVRDFKDDGAEEGMFIYLDSFDATGENKYYRYEYEETYKIIAPFWTNKELYLIPPDNLVDVRIRSQEEQVCFKTNRSADILQAKTDDFNEVRITQFPVRFINRNDFSISHRYSILVKQWIQTREAYVYYNTLNELSGSESVFSQIQTGFLEGNITSTDKNENVVGYFGVSSYDEKRIFFDYVDFFRGEDRPPYIVECPFLSNINALITDIERHATTYWDDNNGQYGNFSKPSPYIVVPVECGDCTVLGSNEVPEFWEE